MPPDGPRRARVARTRKLAPNSHTPSVWPKKGAALKRATAPALPVPISHHDAIVLDARVREYRAQVLAPSTRRLYEDNWQAFLNFCSPKDAWKAAPDDVARWLAYLAGRGFAYTSIVHKLSALNAFFERLGKGYQRGRPGIGVRSSPGRDLIVRQTLYGIGRHHGRIALDQKRALSLRELEKILDSEPETLRGLRNRAMFVLGWGGALRAQEVLSLDAAKTEESRGWFEISNKGVVVCLRSSKTNMAGWRGEERYAIPRRKRPGHCPVRILRRWLRVAKIHEGPLFRQIGKAGEIMPARLGHQTLCLALQKAAYRIGLDPDEIGGRSLRAGCITWLDEQNVEVGRIMGHSGHQSLEALMKYIRRRHDPSRSPLFRTRWVR